MYQFQTEMLFSQSQRRLLLCGTDKCRIYFWSLFFSIHKFGPLILGTRAYSIVFIKTLKKLGQHQITFHFNISEGEGGGGG